MSYCVNCGVELDKTAAFCPLCHTPVCNPNQPVDTNAPPPFPTQRAEVPLASKKEAALLMTVMLLSVAICCGLLNFFLSPHAPWSFYVIGAAIMLWIWLVLPLWMRRIPVVVRLLLDGAAVGVYLLLIALNLDGMNWYLRLGLPVVLLGTAVLLFLGLTLRNRSILSSITLIIGAIGVFLFGVELLVDRWLYAAWTPTWSLIVLTVCIALIIPLVVVRRNPALREEARKRFHL